MIYSTSLEISKKVVNTIKSFFGYYVYYDPLFVNGDFKYRRILTAKLTEYEKCEIEEEMLFELDKYKYRYTK